MEKLYGSLRLSSAYLWLSGYLQGDMFIKLNYRNDLLIDPGTKIFLSPLSLIVIKF